MYFLLSAFGLGAVLLASYEVFTTIKYIGAAYLLYLGIQTFRGAGLALAAVQDNAQPAAPGWRALLRGFSLQAANPKALIFFAALLPQFISPKSAVAPQVAILGMTSVAIEFLVLCGYGYLAGGAARLARQRQFVAATNRASGVMLIAAGTGLALASERFQ
jgi:threonine/homoserine/homoserine lactone efflux protein